MSEPRIVWLDARADTDEETLGPKACGLVRLSRIGLPVPTGFCICTEVYREHVRTSGILRQITSALNSGNAGKSVLREIREAIVSAPMAEATRRAIAAQYRRLGATRVAIRSSATAEDLPGRSFAGQYDTCLGIADLEGCLTAIKQCWASLWTERAWDYRQESGFDHRAVDMAVIVQAFVPADASGVLFTIDPASGRSDRIVVEACLGLGEALVSGRVTPDRFLVRKRDLHLLSRTVGDKKIETVLDPHGGTCQQPVTPERMARTAIDRRTVIRLARLAKQAEARLGGPQDMEWAVHGKTVVFLQSRPITAIRPAAFWEEHQVWTNANLGEVLPDVMTPLTASFINVTDETLLRPILTILGFENVDMGKAQRLIAGRLYFNASMGLAIIRHIPGAQCFNYRALMGGDRAVAPAGGPSDVDEEVPDLQVSAVKMVLRIPWSIRLMVAHRQAKARASIQEIQAVNCRLQDLDFSRMSLEELGHRFTTDVRDGVARLDLLYAVPTMAPLALLYKICERWLGDTQGSVANRLLADTGDMASARAGLDLWRLAAQAREVPPVRAVLLSGGDWQNIRAALQGMAEGQAFLKRWDRFMACHGHHCRGELEFYNPRWSENPGYILKLVRHYLIQTNMPNLLQDRQERAGRREQLRRQCLRRLRNPVKRLIFEHILRAARSGSILRENFKNEAIRWTMTLRRMLLAIGSRFTAGGTLTEPNDIFFLQLPELEAALQGRSDLDIPNVVAARRAEYEKNRSITPPKVVVGRFDPDHYVSAPQDVGASIAVLHGVAASVGVATGKARVILRADSDEQVRAGEILVAPFTDPGWTPYFVPAAGIVTDQGGLLSHGSIIAREYGLPAVVNVPAATKIIKTGQMLRVDGNHGIVTILP